MEINKAILDELYTINDEENQKNTTNLTSDYFIKNNSNFIILKNKLLTTDSAIHLRKHPRFISYPLHSHEYVECTYIISGSVTHIINGQTLVLNKGDFVLFNEKSAHEILACSENDIAMNFITKPAFIKQLLKASSENDDFSQFITRNYINSSQKTYFLFKDIPQDIKSILHLIINHYFSNDLQETINVLFIYVLIELFTKHLLSVEHNSPYDTGYLVLYTKKYIEKEYYNGNLETLSNLLSTNYSYLSSCIKKELGFSFKQLQQQKRLEVALRLIEKSTIPIKEVAYMVGYENMTFFYKIFKQQYGSNPNAFRILNNKKAIV